MIFFIFRSVYKSQWFLTLLKTQFSQQRNKSIKEIKSTSNHKIISFSKSKFYSKDQNKKENIKVLDLKGPLFFGSIVSELISGIPIFQGRNIKDLLFNISYFYYKFNES